MGSKRYVITNPPNDFNLLASDQVFVLMQFDPGMEYRPDWVEANGKSSDHLVRTAQGPLGAGSGLEKPGQQS